MLPNISITVLVEDLQAFEKVFVASWIRGLRDNPQMREKLVQGNKVFGHFLLGRWKLGLFFWVSGSEEVEDELISWVVAEASGKRSALSPGDLALSGSVKELESILEG